MLDEALARVARLEAALAITGGTVHDVNNLLTVLSGNLYLLTEKVRMQDDLFDKVRAARNTATKCGMLMRELLTFSRDTDSGAQTICPANHVSALEPLLRRGISSGHNFSIRVDKEPWSVSASAVQFESAVTNLVINARDALSGEGNILVGVRNVRVDRVRAKELDVRKGDYVCVDVVDNGSGIPASILPRVCRPMFTTKAEGDGTGLGLSMVKRFADQNRGTLRIQSVEGRGTKVQIWLPISEMHAEVTANMTLPLSTLQGGEETVLLVSRDVDVRAAIDDILQALGYTVIRAAMGTPIAEISFVKTTPTILVCERSSQNHLPERRWIDDLRRCTPGLKHIAVLGADTDAEEIAPDADAHLFRPIAIIDLAQTMRAAVEA